MEEHYRKLERMYHGAAANRFFQPTLVVSKGGSELTFRVREEFFHSGGAMHGSFSFKALDDAAFFAANSMVSDRLVLTTTFQIQFLRPVSKGSLRAVGRVVHRARQSVLADSELFNERGKLVARGSGTFAIAGPELTEEIGYA